MQIIPRLRKNGQFSYTVRVRVQGYPEQTQTFSSKREAERWAKNLEVELQSGKLGRSSALTHTLRETIERFLLEKPDGYGAWLHRSVNKASLEWWRANYGSCTLAELNTKLIVQARDHLLDTPSPPKKVGGAQKKRRPSTCNRYISALSSVLQCALERWGWIDDNPCRKIRRLHEKNGRTRFLNSQEQELLLEACKIDPVLYDIVVLALLTGARQGELCSLKWSDVSLQEAMLTFRDTKNGETRAVPLSHDGLEILKRRFCDRRIGGDDWVFPAEKSSGHVEVSKRFARISKKAGLENFRFHDLRHTAASRMAIAGIPILQMQELLGHKSMSMTKRYSHLRPTELRDVANLLGESFKNSSRSLLK